MKWRWWLALLLGVGCSASEPGGLDTAGSGTTGASSTGESAATGSTDGGSTSSGWLCPPDSGPPPCDPLTQNCPDGEKCAWCGPEGGDYLQDTKCVPVDPDPQELYEPCQVDGHPLSGFDSCGPAAMCWGVDPRTLTGECVGMCTGSTMPACADPAAICGFSSQDFALCPLPCDPLMQDCKAGFVCGGMVGLFACLPDAAPGAGEQWLAGCVAQGDCDPGYSCLEGTRLPGCGEERCCTDFCDLALMDNGQCDGAPVVECVSWFQPGSAPVEFEDVGVCMTP